MDRRRGRVPEECREEHDIVGIHDVVVAGRKKVKNYPGELWENVGESACERESDIPLNPGED